MKHPASFYIKYLLVLNPNITDSSISLAITNKGILNPDPLYINILRGEAAIGRPPDFSPVNRTHRASVKYMRDQQVYELFYPSSATTEAFDILADPDVRSAVEQLLMAKLPIKPTIHKINQKREWHLSEDGVKTYSHYFWNVKLLTYDEWGRYLSNRSVMADNYLSLLKGPKELALFTLRLDQNIESRAMIQRVQKLAYFTIEEAVANDSINVVQRSKIIRELGFVLIESHAALSTSEMAMTEVLKQFEKFRMEHKELPPKSIKELAPHGDFSGSGVTVMPVKKTREVEINGSTRIETEVVYEEV